MSRILPPSASSLTEAAVRPVTDAQTVHGTLTKIPQAVVRLPAGTIVPAQVIGPDGKGSILLQSQFGTIALNTGANLPKGSQITVQITGTTAQNRSVTVVLPPTAGAAAAPSAAASGRGTAAAAATQPAASAPAATGNAAQSSVPASGTQAPQSTAPSAGGLTESRPVTAASDARSFTATVTGSPPPGPRPPLPPATQALLQPILTGGSEAPQFAPGSQLTVRVVALQAPAAGPPGQAPAAGLPGTAPTAGVPAPSPTLPTSTSPVAGSPAGSAPAASPSSGNAAVAAQPGARAPAPQNTGAPNPAPVGATEPGPALRQAGAQPPAMLAATIERALIPALVTGTNSAGLPVLQTPFGELALSARAALSAGSTAILDVLSAASPDGAAARGQQALNGIDLSRDWPALKEVMTVLQQGDPAVAARAMGSAAAQPGSRFASDILFLLTALRLGDAQSMLGERATRALAAARPDLAARFGDEFALLSRMAGEASQGDWRAFFLPVHDGHTLQQLRIFSRRQKRKGAGASRDDMATRVVVELELTQLGPMQLDGLAHEGRFDLIVRSSTPLPADVREGIRGIFASIRMGDDWEGELGFQAIASFPINPLEEMEERHIGVIA